VAEVRGLVRAGVSATFRDYLRRYPQITPERLVLAAGLDPSQLGKPEALIDQKHWFLLVEAAARETGDSAFAIGFSEQLPLKDLGVLGYVGLHSPTLGAALDNMVRYFAVQQTGGHFEVVGGREPRVEYVLDDPRITDYAQMAEANFAIAIRLFREAMRDPAWAPREVRFRHAGPPTDHHRRFFRAPLVYRHRTNAMVLSPGDRERTFIAADAGLLPHLLRHAEDCLVRMPEASDVPAAEADVRRAVIAAISAGDPSIHRVATQLALTPRTLQRRLAAGGGSFKTLIDDTRLDLAKRYLADPALTLTEAAFLLGYSDLSAFSRAVRRWTGKTALELSRTARIAASSPRPTRTR
jgi:AraC-like DNA-binding protein